MKQTRIYSLSYLYKSKVTCPTVDTGWRTAHRVRRVRRVRPVDEDTHPSLVTEVKRRSTVGGGRLVVCEESYQGCTDPSSRKDKVGTPSTSGTCRLSVEVRVVCTRSRVPRPTGVGKSFTRWSLWETPVSRPQNSVTLPHGSSDTEPYRILPSRT